NMDAHRLDLSMLPVERPGPSPPKCSRPGAILPDQHLCAGAPSSAAAPNRYAPQRSSLRRCPAGWLLRRAAGPAGREVRIQERAATGWTGTDVLTALLKPLQRLA